MEPIMIKAPLTIDWEALNTTRREVKKFFLSLNEKNIGTSLVKCNDNFTLSPRPFGTSGTEANFGQTQEAFIELKNKIRDLSKIIYEKVDNIDYCPLKAERFLLRIAEIDTIIENIAERGLKRICQNYENKKESEKAENLKKLGLESIRMIRILKETLADRMKNKVKNLDEKLELIKFSMSAGKLLIKSLDYIETYSHIKCDKSAGIIIPAQLVNETSKSLRKGEGLKQYDVRNAAKLFRLFSQAQPIKIQNRVSWTPERPVINDKEISFKKGVIGTFEKKEKATTTINLCNVYHCTDQAVNQFTIRCGSIDSSIKARQLVEVISNIKKHNQENRFMLYQLNSFSTEIC